MISVRMFTVLATVVAVVLGLAAQCAPPAATTPPPEQDPTVASIGDLVWHDADRDGIRDDPEGGMADVPVELYGSDDTPAGSTTTDEDGSYLFRGVAPGDYYVKFTLPTGYVFTQQDQGDDDSVDSDADTTTGKTILITLAAGETDLTWDAGMYQFPAGPTPTPTLPMVEGPTPTPTQEPTPPPTPVTVPCEDDEECPWYKVCDHTVTPPVCVPRPCEYDGDCPYGRCDNETCVPLPCEFDADCPPWMQCLEIENLCAPPGCRVGADCPSFTECTDGQCLAQECVTDDDCDEGLECNADGYCWQYEDECSSNDDCPEGLVCRLGACAQCAIEAHCPFDTWCDVAQEPPVCVEYVGGKLAGFVDRPGYEGVVFVGLLEGDDDLADVGDDDVPDVCQQPLDEANHKIHTCYTFDERLIVQVGADGTWYVDGLLPGTYRPFTQTDATADRVSCIYAGTLRIFTDEDAKRGNTLDGGNAGAKYIDCERWFPG